MGAGWGESEEGNIHKKDGGTEREALEGENVKQDEGWEIKQVREGGREREREEGGMQEKCRE